MGLRMKLHTPTSDPVPIAFADVGDNFDRADGQLANTYTPVGAKRYVISGGNTGNGPVIASGVAKASSAQPNAHNLTVELGAQNYDIVARVAGLHPTNPVSSLQVNLTGNTDRAAINLRQGTNTPGYTITNVNGSTVTNVLTTGRAPANGDVILVEVRGNAVALYVNGTYLGTGTITAIGAYAGMRFDPTDLVTGFDDLCIYYR